MTELNPDCLPQKQIALFHLLKTRDWLKEYYMAGGTGLALQIRHRESIDFDFFTGNDINNDKLDALLNKTGIFRRTYEEQNTLYGELNGIRISFIKYDYPLIQDVIMDQHLSVAGLKDISAMKLSAILSRGTRKDFVDLFFLLKIFQLKEMFGFYERKYNVEEYQYTLVRSLLYFDDAEQDPLPRMIEVVNWDEIKKKITGEVKKIKLI
jgi:hypothetical protein